MNDAFAIFRPIIVVGQLNGDTHKNGQTQDMTQGAHMGCHTGYNKMNPTEE